MTKEEARDFQARFFLRNPHLEAVVQLMAANPRAAVFVKDLHHRYVLGNAMHLMTYDLMQEEEIVGKRARDAFPDLLAEAYEANDRKVFSRRESLLNEIWLVPHVRGTPRWFVSGKAPLFDRNGEVMGLVGQMRPIATPEDQQAVFGELQKVVDYLEDHFVDEITIEALAKMVGWSVAHFNRRFRELLRLSPMEYVTSLRIQEGQRLLATTQMSVGDVSALTGFYDQSHFTKRFKRVTGMTPLAYRKKFLR
ncbi:MAG: AraC family transcriptional regulator [Verrucomicrobiota bacterium]